MNRPRDLSTGSAEEAAYQRAFPDKALAEGLGNESALLATLRGSGGAFSAGRTELIVPPALAGGRMSWQAPLGVLRETLTARLDALVSGGVVRRAEARAVVARFGLDGVPGDAATARTATGRQRQATTDAINRAIAALAADLAMHPLMPVAAPDLTAARRQLIVGATLSLMGGSAKDYPLRLYVHMRVRAELLGDPEFRVGPAAAADRQRRHRAQKRWLAIAADHLDRDEIPLARAPGPTPSDHEDVAVWRKGDRREGLSPGGLRALTASSEDVAAEAIGDARRAVGLLLDGYRPLIEILRAAAWLRRGPSAPTWRKLEPPSASQSLRASGLLVTAGLLAARGYPDAAVLYIGFAHDVGHDQCATDAESRFMRLMALEGVSHLRGSAALDKTRRWHAALVDHLQRHGAVHSGEPLAVAHAIMRTEHFAWTAGSGSGASLAELLSPLGDSLEEALAASPAENRRRFEIQRARLAAVLEDREALELHARGDNVAPRVEVNGEGTRFDEWYCAHTVATARWDQRRTVRGQDEWRR